MISSELEELVEGSSRVVVMRDGQRVGELRGREISQDAIIHAMAEGSSTGAEAVAAEDRCRRDGCRSPENRRRPPATFESLAPGHR